MIVRRQVKAVGRRSSTSPGRLKHDEGVISKPRYLISFDDGSMDHIPEQDLPEVDEKVHAVVQEAKDAGVWIFGGGVHRQQAAPATPAARFS